MFDPNKVNFNVAKLAAIIETAKSSSKGSEDEASRTKVAFLPNGRHKIRFFHDPDGELLRTVAVHRIGKYMTHCPNYLKEQRVEGCSELPDCEICEIADQIDDWKKSPSRRFSVLIYGHLYETDSQSDYWTPGNTYLIVGKNKLKTSLMSLLTSLVKDAEDYIMSMLTPQIRGGMITVDVTGGTQGAVNLTPIPGSNKDPIEIGEWWKPISTVYVPKSFEIETYKLALDLAKQGLKEFIAENPVSETETSSQESSPSEKPIEASPQESASSEKPAEASKESLDSSEVSNKVAEAVTQASSGLEPNQIKTRMNRIVTIPAFAIEANCWSKYNAAQPVCVGCPINLDCMVESKGGI